MSDQRLTDRYCPFCFSQLKEGRSGFLFCPDYIDCEYDCDTLVNDTTLTKFQAQYSKVEKLKLILSHAQAAYDKEFSILSDLFADISEPYLNKPRRDKGTR